MTTTRYTFEFDIEDEFNYPIEIEAQMEIEAETYQEAITLLREATDYGKQRATHITTMFMEEASGHPVIASEEAMSPTEGVDGFHNMIEGYSCPNCHDQGCRFCWPPEELY